MADLSITVAEVQPGTVANGAVFDQGTAGATITAGQCLYIDTSASNVLKLAQADGTALEATCCGLALHAALTGQPIRYQKEGPMTIGATASVTEGLIYIVSGAAGGLSPHTDATTPASTEYCSIVGVGNGSDQILIKIHNSGQQVA